MVDPIDANRRNWDELSESVPRVSISRGDGHCRRLPGGEKGPPTNDQAKKRGSNPAGRTVLGHAAMIAAGEFVQASGTWVNDRTHGVEFRESLLKAAAPTTTEGIEKYLGSGMIRG